MARVGGLVGWLKPASHHFVGSVLKAKKSVIHIFNVLGWKNVFFNQTTNNDVK